MAQVNVTDLIAPVAQRVRECPSSVLIRNYVAAVREFCNKTRWLTRTVTGATTIDQVRYNLGDDPHLEIIGIHAMSIARSADDLVPVTAGDPTRWDGSAPHELSNQYVYIPHAQFALSPKPDQAYDLTITAVVQPKRGAVSIPEELVTDWEEAFIAGALYRIMRIAGQPWTDLNESGNQLLLFNGELAHGHAAVFAGNNAGAAVTDQLGGGNSTPRSRVLPI